MKEPKDYLIFPLDLPSADAALAYVDQLRHLVGTFKVGLELFVKSGPEIIRRINQRSPASKLFLDLKLHDIPETVHRAMLRIADYGIDLATVHCGDSCAMLEAAVRGAGGSVRVLGVTVLTSVAGSDLKKAGYDQAYAGNLQKLVLKKAAAAAAAGCAGVICSPLEAGSIKARFGGDFLAVTPGVRPGGGKGGQDDQVRVATPAGAIMNGSDYLVIGRPIRDAHDPAAAAAAILREIEAVL